MEYEETGIKQCDGAGTVPDEVAEIMTAIRDEVTRKLGEMSLLCNIAEKMDPVRKALVLTSVEEPGFLMKTARQKHSVLAQVTSGQLPYEKVQIEETLYENGIYAKWHVYQNVRRTRHELVVYYVKPREG